MKKINILFLFILVSFFIGINNIKAETIIECPKYVMPGNKIECVVKYNNLTNARGIESRFEMSDNLSYVSMDLANDWEILTGNSKGFYAISNKKEENMMLLMNFVVSSESDPKDNLLFNVKDIVVTDGNSENITRDESVSIDVLSIEEIVDKIIINNKEYEVKNGLTVYPIMLEDNINKAKVKILTKNKDFVVEDNKKEIIFDNLKEGQNIKSINIYYKNNKLVEYTFKFNVKLLNKQKEEKNPPTNTFSIISIVLGIFIVGIILFVSTKKIKNIRLGD